MEFSYSEAQLANIETTLSTERLSTYLAQTGADRKRAILLYECNSHLSESLYTPLQGLEVALRNSFQSQLEDCFARPDWYEDRRSPLSALHRDMVLKAKTRLTEDGKPHDPGRVVAELTFGFWTAMVGKKYAHSLWVPCLHKAFPRKKVGRKQVHLPLDRLRKLRNRIAHHEPVLARDLAEDYWIILEVVGWICPDTSAWIAETSRFPSAHDAYRLLFP